ncbi:helix-turn-helix domain-containing protein [Microtetraspora malaysiensis]|uniref:helix-turn-helix domain-containing protein n=1 Tax=Microtetraspora malaysiensis TaxID=161358 RepID=UPI003D8FB48C
MRRALAFLEAHPDQDVTVADIAAAAHVTVRTIRLAFRRHLDTTPVGYLRRIRLHHAHEDLRTADAGRGDSVAAIARCGLAHHGRALLSAGIQAINQAVAKDQHAISFPEEIHRNGPGHLAIVDLPFGVEAADVVARPGKLASGLRLPLDQVWPDVATGHPGRLALWVGYERATTMEAPPWPLLKSGSVDVFQPFPLFITPRMETVNAMLSFRNWLIGGQPGSGKTFLLRLLVLAASLDPRAEIRGYESKGVGDFKAVEPVCAEYGNGQDDETIARAAALIKWLYHTECQQRAAKISHYHELGLAPENKVTPELASRKGSGLHPLVAWSSPRSVSCAPKDSWSASRARACSSANPQRWPPTPSRPASTPRSWISLPRCAHRRPPTGEGRPR